MKKNTLMLLAALMLILSTAHAQQSSNVTDEQHRIQVGLTSNYNMDNKRVGATALVKWLLPTSQPSSHRFLITAKAAHTPASNGGFFKAFDKGKYDNISALHLLAGYRLNFYDDSYILNSNKLNDGLNSFFVELNAGAAYIHRYAKVGLSAAPTIGYSFKQKVDVLLGYQGAYLSDAPNVNLVELGLAFRLK